MSKRFSAKFKKKIKNETYFFGLEVKVETSGHPIQFSSQHFFVRIFLKFMERVHSKCPNTCKSVERVKNYGHLKHHFSKICKNSKRFVFQKLSYSMSKTL
jgi:hypothetical protein